jgi:hypothetical protein
VEGAPPAQGRRAEQDAALQNWTCKNAFTSWEYVKYNLV